MSHLRFSNKCYQPTKCISLTCGIITENVIHVPNIYGPPKRVYGACVATKFKGSMKTLLGLHLAQVPGFYLRGGGGGGETGGSFSP